MLKVERGRRKQASGRFTYRKSKKKVLQERNKKKKSLNHQMAGSRFRCD